MICLDTTFSEELARFRGRCLSAFCCLLGWMPAASMGTGADTRVSVAQDPRFGAVIDSFRHSVADMMAQHKVPGCAYALVTSDGLVWAEGFGATAPKSKIPVTPDTPFFLGGMAKLVSATAVMMAVQDGKVGLDSPVVDYLPDFNVKSRYEPNASQLIRVKHLLNQTAALPVEAPLGNYFEPLSGSSFEQHIKSLYGNWLVFPVGKAFQNGNAAPDLAAYIVQVRAGQRFEDYLRQKLFTPLGMSHSSADASEILARKDRAAGSMLGIAKMPATLPCLGSASIYSSARDLASFLEMHITGGLHGTNRVLRSELVDFLHTPTAVVEPGKLFHAASVYISKRGPRADTMLWLDGWGFGVSGLMYWLPDYGIGLVALANRLPNPSFNKVAFSLTDRLIEQNLVTTTTSTGFAHTNTNGLVNLWVGWGEHKPTPFRPEWQKLCDSYRLTFNAYELEWWAKIAVFIKGRDEFTPQVNVHVKNGFLCITESPFFDLIGIGRHKDDPLQELAPGIFSARSGVVLDFTHETPRWRNYRMQRH